MTAISVIIHAEAKVGKTTLTTTSPPPMLVLDVEGGWKFVRQAGFNSGKRLRRIEWDPVQTPPPRHDGSWDLCHVTVREWRTLTQAYMWLTHTKEHDFRSLIIDSVTEAQRQLRTYLKPDGRLVTYIDWGDLLHHMDKLIRDFRDLTLLPEPNPLDVVTFIAETEMKNDKWRPAMQGQIGRSLPYHVDICGYLYTEPLQDSTGVVTGYQRKLLIGQGIAPNIITGERVQGTLPPIIEDPNITSMVNAIFGFEEGNEQ